MPTVKWFFGAAAASSSKTAFTMRRREFLRRQAVAAADHRSRIASCPASRKRRDDVEVERLAERARLLRAVEHGDRLDRRRQRGHEVLGGERAVEPDLEHADLLAARHQPLDQFVRHLGARAHHHDDALGLGVADVVEQVVLAADELGELVHRLLHEAPARPS